MNIIYMACPYLTYCDSSLATPTSSDPCRLTASYGLVILTIITPCGKTRPMKDFSKRRTLSLH